jgi:modulator of FtsH protease HflC
MNRGVIGGIVAVIVGVILLQSSYFIVHPFEWALVLQFGSPVRPIENPGIYFKLPFVQNVVYFDRRVLNFDAQSDEVPTSDQKQVIVSAFARYQIVNPLLFYQTVNNEEGVQLRLGAIISSNLRQVLGREPMSSILTAQRAVFMRDIASQVDADAQSFGIRVIDVRMKRVDLPLANSQAIFGRMKAQREQAARKIRAEGQAAGVTLKAEADKQEVVIVADARRQASILRGQGDAQSTSIFAAAYGRDPAFFDFYRSLQAMTTGLNGESTTYVGPPDGDFFRYFLKDTGPAAAPAQAGSPQALPVPAAPAP